MTISAIHDRVDKETTERRKELEKAHVNHVNLKGTLFLLYRAPCLVNQICRPAVLARVLDAACSPSTRPPGVPSAKQHSKNLNLDAARISLAKVLNDADSPVTSKQAELTRLKEELRELEESDPAAGYEPDGRA